MPLFRKALLLLIITATLISTLVIAQPYERDQVLNPAIGFNKVTFAHKNGDKQLHYAYSGNPEKPGVLFIHGTPGGWGAFERYLTNPSLRQELFMVSVDRLGWGESPMEKKDIDGSFNDQANAITRVLAEYPNKKWVVVGHSLGASIAPKVALAAPESVNSLVLLAGSLKPRLGKPRWYNHAANNFFIGKLLSTHMKNSNKEIMALREQLNVMDQEIKSTQLDTHLVVIQGMKDKLVSSKNPRYVDTQWRDHFASTEIIELPNAGHFLPWNQTPLVIDTIRQMAEKILVAN